MTSERATAYELEDEADLARMRLGESLFALKRNLRPSHLFTEWANASGVNALQAPGWLDRNVQQHPIPTLLAGLVTGSLIGMALRRSGGGRPSYQFVDSRNGLKDRLSQSVGSLADTAAQVIRERVDRKATELMETARSSVQRGADNASQALEGTIDRLTRSSTPEFARPAVSSASKLALLVIVEALIRRVAIERLRNRADA